jgi:glucokinase
MPRIRFWKRWYNVLWIIPLGTVGLIISIALAQDLRQNNPAVQQFIARYKETYPSADYTSLGAIVTKFVASHGAKSKHACFGVAGPVRNDQVNATNLPWTVDASRLAHEITLKNVTLINDLEAIAYSVEVLEPKDFAALNEGDPKAAGNAAVIAAGTGLGQAGLCWDGVRRLPFACEGGHADFAPADDLQDELLRYLRAQFGHVSWERVLSGPGLLNIYNFLRDTGRGQEPDWLKQEMAKGDRASQISRHGLDGTDALCCQSLELFVSLYGSEAGNLALKIMATGGVYIGGGIAPKIVNRLRDPNFLEAFTAKGRLTELLKAIPVRVILNDQTGLLGAAHCAALNRDLRPGRNYQPDVGRL